MEFTLTPANPEYSEIRKHGYAFIQAPEWGNQHGSPYMNESYESPEPEQTCIIWWNDCFHQNTAIEHCEENDVSAIGVEVEYCEDCEKVVEVF